MSALLGIIGLDDVVRKVQAIDKIQVEENEREMQRYMASQRNGGA